MILAVSIGNTNTALALKQDGQPLRTARYRTGGGEYGMMSEYRMSEYRIMEELEEFLSGAEGEPVTGAVISSVNPELTGAFERAVKDLLGAAPLRVSAQMNMKLDLSCYDTGLIGSDRIAVCEAAVHKYKLPAIVFDFGTATTINVIDKNGRFSGGSILPGLITGAKALAGNTAQLPLSDPDMLEKTAAPLIGRDTRECIKSGVIHGNAAMFDGMTERIQEHTGEARVIVTGGGAEYVLPFCRAAYVYEPELLVEGLFFLYNLNLQKINDFLT